MSDALHRDNEGGICWIENELMFEAWHPEATGSHKRRRFGEMQLRDDLGDEFFRGMRNVENQSVLRLFQVGELSGEDGFSGEVAVPRFDVAAHDFVGSTEIDDAHVERDGELVAVGLL